MLHDGMAERRERRMLFHGSRFVAAAAIDRENEKGKKKTKGETLTLRFLRHLTYAKYFFVGTGEINQPLLD